MHTDRTIVTRRVSTGRSQPTLAQEQDVRVVGNNSGIFDGQMRIQFVRPLKPQPAEGVEVAFTGSETSSDIIWAVNNRIKPTGTSFAQHTSFGIRRGSNLFAASSAFRDTSSTFAAKDNSRENMVLIHGILMTVAWLVCAPAGVAVARFFKAKLGKWWFRIHVFLMFVCMFLPSSVLIPCHRRWYD